MFSGIALVLLIVAAPCAFRDWPLHPVSPANGQILRAGSKVRSGEPSRDLLQLIGALRPALMKAHFLVSFAILRRPVKRAGDVFHVSAVKRLESQEGGEKR